MTVQTLIEEMLQVKQEYPALERSEILRIFNIQALKDLTIQIKRLAIANDR